MTLTLAFFPAKGVIPASYGRLLDELIGKLARIKFKALHNHNLGDSPMLNAGDKAPNFTLPDQHGNKVKLSELKGGPVVLYFYPKADTPGCTTQACGIRDRRAEYDALGATVLGVSPDAPVKIEKFDSKHGLGFTLLGDEDHSVSEAYGTWVEKSMYGKTYMGVQRATFIIDANGKIAHVIPKVSPKTHDDQVLAALAELG